jgi:hypothetical protein
MRMSIGLHDDPLSGIVGPVAPHPPLLRRLALIAVTVLAWTALGIASAPSAQAAGGLALSGNARFVVNIMGSVAVTETVTLTNQEPDSGGRYYYWDSFAFSIPNSASEVAITSRGTPPPSWPSASSRGS